MQNPYTVLQLDHTAPIEVLRTQYQSLKKKYSEDRFLHGAAGNLAAEKLTELELAWQQIELELTQNATSGDLEHITKLINSGAYAEAQEMLDAKNEHSAEWHFVQAMLFFRRDWATESKRQLEIALSIEPHNHKYITAMDKLKYVMGNPATPPHSLGNVPPGLATPGQQSDLCNAPCATCCFATMCLNCCLPICGGR